MTVETRTHSGESYTYEGLYNLSGPEMVKLYNRLCPDNPTKRFGDKKAGVTRIWAALEGQPAAAGPSPDAVKLAPAPAPEKPVKAPETPEAPKPKVKAAKKPRERRFVYPPLAEIKHPKNAKSMRAILLRMMSRPQGATFNQLMAATWGKRDDMTVEVQDKTTYEGIRLCHTYVGYGLRQYRKADATTHSTCPDDTPEGAIYLIGHGNRRVPPITFDESE